MKHYTPELLIKSYALGVFPMAEHREDARIFFVDPPMRGVIPLRPPRLSRGLKRLLRQDPFPTTINQDFAGVIAACREATPRRQDTWINAPIEDLFCTLHRLGFAHSVEVWDDSGQLIGGIYGMALGGAFFGESMFSRVSNASKCALLHMMARVLCGGFVLFDTQFLNPHLVQFGGAEISRAEFQTRLKTALETKAQLPLDSDSSPFIAQLLHDSMVRS